METKPTNEKTYIGQLGEAATATYLRRNGYQILARNWRNGRYEIDLIATRAGTLHFVEVKTRKEQGLTAPEDAITPQKRLALRYAARAFLAGSGNLYRGYDVQFDLAAVRHLPDGTLHLDWIEEAIEFGW